jgi:hypothetical protein
MKQYEPIPNKEFERPNPPPPPPPRQSSNLKPIGQDFALPVEIVTDILLGISEDARMEIFNKFCKHCGSDNPNCQCWNDE